MPLLILDNYDSFTYNLVHLVEKCGVSDFVVAKNDQVPLSEISAFDMILLSPGPGLPSEAGIMPELLDTFATTKKIFGVCLGLQAIGQRFGVPLLNLDQVAHAKASTIQVLSHQGLFKDCPRQFIAGRYHSWVLDNQNMGPELEVTAVDNEGQVMAARHRCLDVQGVQFHPESVLSEFGELILSNWLHTP